MVWFAACTTESLFLLALICYEKHKAAINMNRAQLLVRAAAALLSGVLIMAVTRVWMQKLGAPSHAALISFTTGFCAFLITARLTGFPGMQRLFCRLAFYIGLAFLASVALELTVFNLDALETRGLQPISLSMEDAKLSDTLDRADQLIVSDSQATTGTVCWENVDIANVQSVAVSYNAKHAILNYSVALKDDASTGRFTEAAVDMGSTILDEFATSYARLKTNGALHGLELSLRFDLSHLKLQSVVLNQPIPLCFQFGRVFLVFAILALLLCACHFRWYAIAFDRKKMSHLLVLMIPMLILCAFSYKIASYLRPNGDLFYDLTLEEAETSYADPMAVMLATLMKGRTSLAVTPSAELLSLENPYDVSARDANEVTYLFDYALYEGKYYVYFGLAPLLLIYLPYYALRGGVPQLEAAAMLLAILTICAIYFAVCALTRRYCKKRNLFLLSLACLTVVFASQALMLLSSADRYHNQFQTAMLCFAASVGFGFSAVQQKKRWLRTLEFVMAGAFVALLGAARANQLVMIAAFMAPAFVMILLDSSTSLQAKWKDALAFLVPACVGVALIMLYNAVRFDSPFDFGQNYQLTVNDVRTNTFQLRGVGQAIYHYLLEPAGFSNRFPHFFARSEYNNVSGNYFYGRANVGVMGVPMMGCLLLSIYSWRKRETEALSCCRERRATMALPLLASLPLMVMCYFIGGVAIRYTCDFFLCFALVSAIPLMDCVAYGEGAGTERKIISTLAIALCLLTIYMGFCFIFANYRNFLYVRAPSVYCKIADIFAPF